MSYLITPHGGTLHNLYVPPTAVESFKNRARDLVSWDLTARQLGDLELLLSGGFSPLGGFLQREDHERVLAEMRLSNGTFWPMPITLDVSEAFASRLGKGEKIALRDAEGVLIALLEIEDIWRPNKTDEAQQLFGTTELGHPGVFHLLHRVGPIYVGGRVRGLSPPTHYDFPHWRRTPGTLREQFVQLDWQRIAACDTGALLQRSWWESAQHTVVQINAKLLIHPSVGLAKPSDDTHYAWVRCYQHLLQTSLPNANLNLLPLVSRMAGARETLWRAIIHQNHGCSHFIVARPEAEILQPMLTHYQNDLAIQILPFSEWSYVPEQARYLPREALASPDTALHLAADQFQERLREGLAIPEWVADPEIVAELRHLHPPRAEQGFTVFFTGLSGSGKSTIANALMVKLLELGGRAVTLLDGDLVRKHLSSELGFSREHRHINILRIGFVASEITKNGGIAICAPIAPYAAIRREVREMIAPLGGFIEVYVATPLALCEQRDRKGLYAKARAGLLTEFTGISDPYEAPINPEVTLETHDCTPGEAAEHILATLKNLGYISH